MERSNDDLIGAQITVNGEPRTITRHTSTRGRFYTYKEIDRRDLIHLFIGWLIGVIAVGGTVLGRFWLGWW